jgi:hypothetical protein
MGLDTKIYWLTDRQSQCDFDFDYDWEGSPEGLSWEYQDENGACP